MTSMRGSVYLCRIGINRKNKAPSQCVYKLLSNRPHLKSTFECDMKVACVVADSAAAAATPPAAVLGAWWYWSSPSMMTWVPDLTMSTDFPLCGLNL